MSLQVTEETNIILEKHKSDLGGSDLQECLREDNKGCDSSLILPRPPNFDNRRISVSERFVKFVPSEKALQLLSKNLNAFALLCLIAVRARRTSDPLNELEIGEAYIGDYESCGLTRKKYRTALKFLCDRKFVKITFIHRKSEKWANERAIKPTTNGTIVKLLCSDVWDINIEDDNHPKGHRKGQCRANDGPMMGHKQERKERKECEENIVPNGTLAPTASQRRKIDPLKFSFESWSFEGIVEKDHENWGIAYPDIKIQQEIAIATQWLISNPRKAKAKKHWRKFLTGWFLRANEKSSNRAAYSSQGNKGQQNNKEKVMEKFQNGEFYNEAECFINDEGIAFQRGMKHRQLKFKELGFQDQFENILRDFGIRIEKIF